MFCIVSFVVLSILGIFSASNRELARESLDCVFRRFTFRPCNTGFDEKMKAKILGVVITRSEKAARFLNRFFEPLSWAFFIAMLLSLVFFMRGVYLYYVTGSCNGENSTAFCVFDPTGANNQASQVEAVCTVPASIDELKLNIQSIDQLDLPQIKPQAAENIIMIACYHCEYSRKAYPLVRELIERFDAGLTFVHYPVKEPTDKFSRLAYCVNKLEPEKFWDFNDSMFTGEAADLDDDAYLEELMARSALDPAEIGVCTAAAETEAIVADQMQQIVDTGFTGTPTVLIKDRLFIGPKPIRVYAIALEGLLYWIK